MPEDKGQACFGFFKAMQLLSILDTKASVKHLQSAKSNSKHQQADHGGTVQTHTHRLWQVPFTYYELPFKTDTLLSVFPLEECGWEGPAVKATCLTQQPGVEEEEWKEEEGREEELAGRKAQRLWPSGPCQEPI